MPILFAQFFRKSRKNNNHSTFGAKMRSHDNVFAKTVQLGPSIGVNPQYPWFGGAGEEVRMGKGWVGDVEAIKSYKLNEGVVSHDIGTFVFAFTCDSMHICIQT